MVRAVLGSGARNSIPGRPHQVLRPDGSEQPANSGAPPVLVAFGPGALEQIERSGISGALVTSWSWRSGDYDAQGDFAKSLEEGYRAIRERVVAGGPGWNSK